MPKKRPSATAKKVAGDFLYRVEDPAVEKLAPRGSRQATLDLMTAAGIWKPWMAALIRAGWYRRFAEWAERATMPGQLLHLVLRKRFIDDEVRTALDRGALQVLVVGGGFDTLCLRLAPEYTSVTFVEIDHPPTHAVKVQGVHVMAAERPNLHFEGVDLGERTLSGVLEALAVWTPEVQSVVVVEGVLMYLTEDDVVSLLETVRSSTSSGSRLIASWVFEDSLRRQSLGWLGGVLKLFLRLAGEPFRWGVDEKGIEPFLLQHGFAADDASRFDLRTRYLEPAGEGSRSLARFERVVAADSVA